MIGCDSSVRKQKDKVQYPESVWIHLHKNECENVNEL